MSKTLTAMTTYLTVNYISGQNTYIGNMSPSSRWLPRRIFIDVAAFFPFAIDMISDAFSYLIYSEEPRPIIRIRG